MGVENYGSSKDFRGAISDRLVFKRKFITEHPKKVQAAVEASKFLFENKFTKTKVETSRMFDDRFVKAYLAKVRSK